LRLKKGITQEELAAKTDISVRTFQRIESGEVDPRAFTLQSIATALEVDYEVLVSGERDSGTSDEKGTSRWLPLLHLSGMLLLIVPPIILWIWKRDEVTNMRKHGIDVINFQLSMSLYLIPCVLFSIYPFLIVIAVYSQVIIILNTVKVTNNQSYKYPLTIQFIKTESMAKTEV
jgi:uncharacterized Tic20 family protein